MQTTMKRLTLQQFLDLRLPKEQRDGYLLKQRYESYAQTFNIGLELPAVSLAKVPTRTGHLLLLVDGRQRQANLAAFYKSLEPEAAKDFSDAFGLWAQVYDLGDLDAAKGLYLTFNNNRRNMAVTHLRKAEVYPDLAGYQAFQTQVQRLSGWDLIIGLLPITYQERGEHLLFLDRIVLWSLRKSESADGMKVLVKDGISPEAYDIIKHSLEDVLSLIIAKGLNSTPTPRHRKELIKVIQLSAAALAYSRIEGTNTQIVWSKKLERWLTFALRPDLVGDDYRAVLDKAWGKHKIYPSGGKHKATYFRFLVDLFQDNRLAAVR